MKHELERILGREISTDYRIGSHLRRFRQHIHMEGDGYGSWKIFGSGCGAPLVRIDAKPHDGMPSDHLQYGKKDFTGRSGNEAFDIFGELFRLNTGIELPRPPEMMMPQKPFIGQY